MSKKGLVVKKTNKSQSSTSSSEVTPSKKSRKEVDLSDAMEQEVQEVTARKPKSKQKKYSSEPEDEEDATPQKKSFKKQSVKAFESFNSDDENSGDEDVASSKKKKSKKSSDSDDEVIVLKSSSKKRRYIIDEDEDEIITPSSRSSSSSRSPASSQREEVELVSEYGFKKTKKGGTISTLNLDERYPVICNDLNISPSSARFIMKLEEDLFNRIISAGTSEELITKQISKRFNKKSKVKGVPQTSSPSEKGIYTVLITLATEIRKACNIQLKAVPSTLITLWMTSYYYSIGDDTQEFDFYTHTVLLTASEKKSDKTNKPFGVSAPDALCYVIGMITSRGSSHDSCLWYDNSIAVSFGEIMSMFATEDTDLTDTEFSISVARKGKFPATTFVINYDRLAPYMRTIRGYFDTLDDMKAVIKFTKTSTGQVMNLTK